MPAITIEINKKYAKAYFNRRLAKEKVGDMKGACKDAKKAKSLGYKSAQNETWIENYCTGSIINSFPNRLMSLSRR